MTPDQETVNRLSRWFHEYVSGFKSGDAELDLNITLKEDHTERVRAEAIYIGRSLNLTERDLRLAEIMALFHDTGRFEQFARYHTFVDRISTDHAELGVKILREKQVLRELEEQELVLSAIGNHNKQKLPDNQSEDILFFSRILRDADKLDIWHVFTEYYRDDAKSRDRTIVHDLPDTPEVSENIWRDLIARKMASYAEASSLTDFKLLQAGWIYDVNFKSTFRRVQERQYLDQIRLSIPSSPQIEKVFATIQIYLDSRLKDKGHI